MDTLTTATRIFFPHIENPNAPVEFKYGDYGIIIGAEMLDFGKGKTLFAKVKTDHDVIAFINWADVAIYAGRDSVPF